MKKSEFKYNSNCNLTRAERRAFERKFKKADPKARTIASNAAFTKIVPELLKLGWIYDENYGTAVDFGDGFLITHSPTIKLGNKIFNVKLIPHANGIEISRFEVLEKYQDRGLGGTLLVNLLRFLNKYEIDEIYVLPMPAGFGGSNESLADNQEDLEHFYIKRGFLKGKESRYWKLDSKLFQERYAATEIDVDLLRRSSHIIEDQDPKIFIKVFFEFEGDNKKNFEARYQYPDYNTIRDNICQFNNCLPECPPEIPDIKKILSKTNKSDLISDEDLQGLNHYFGILLAEYVEETGYKTTLNVLGGILVGFLFINFQGVENGINTFRIIFRKNRTLHLSYKIAA